MCAPTTKVNQTEVSSCSALYAGLSTPVQTAPLGLDGAERIRSDRQHAMFVLCQQADTANVACAAAMESSQYAAHGNQLPPCGAAAAAEAAAGFQAQ